ncbi:Altered inheritance of mitochondria protein 18 mitochondrial [Aspergillus nanangensis]|uniref:Altered inheritance of mitochondria protein 18 mitochondrial n=1 Tax=Aspergillus nanangensis TaxID=2582783 RepID=A0AAD4CFB9_ASPNN|nr:Altered inheritance of mitochondria protein 18 mitochondrial [Aspergillus nanangensis]
MASPSSLQGAMPWRTYSQCMRRSYLRSSPTTRFISTTRPLRTTHANPLRTAGNVRNKEAEIAKYRRSMTLSAAGIAACAVAMYGVIQLDMFGLDAKPTDAADAAPSSSNKTMKLDGPDGFTSSPSVIRIQGQDGAEQVSTGTSTIPYFPSTIQLPKTIDTTSVQSGQELGPSTEQEEYQLLGLGIRTVSFLKIQVYVVGLYVAKNDISELQQRLVRTAVNPPGKHTQSVVDSPGATSATLLVSTERQQLKELLLDPEQSDAVWDAILKPDGLRTAFRIVPTRNTDFLHLRDGWVRGITGRAQRVAGAAPAASPGEFQDESFGAALNDFKGLFGGGQRKNVPKGQTLVLVRNGEGALDALFQADAEKPARFMGRVADERISRLVWLNYLAGKNVSSEGARQSVVDGVMGIVERPVGTVVQKVI